MEIKRKIVKFYKKYVVQKPAAAILKKPEPILLNIRLDREYKNNVAREQEIVYHSIPVPIKRSGLIGDYMERGLPRIKKRQLRIYLRKGRHLCNHLLELERDARKMEKTLPDKRNS